MELSQMAMWGKFKGIQVLASADFTHPFWFEKLKTELEEAGNGLYRLKRRDKNQKDIQFLLSCEISSIYSQGGKGRRVHNLFFFPKLESVEKFNSQMVKRGANLRSDGRPIVGITSKDLAKLALECDEKALIIPAHAWTPWFSVYGSFSGFDSIEECFGEMAEYIYGIETGLSSDPAMNWQVGDLDRRSILSFSDAHSLEKMGREATVFEGPSVSYDTIYDAIRGNQFLKKNPELAQQGSTSKIAFTIEFYPEEGKYHFTGHRDCGVSYSPLETNEKGRFCPVCRRELTVGVMHRVGDLKTQEVESKADSIGGVRWTHGSNGRAPYVNLVPLYEIIAESLETTAYSKKTVDCFQTLVANFNSEFNVLLKADLSEIAKFVPEKLVEGIEKVRSGNIVVEPGYDGKFGVVKIWPETSEDVSLTKEEETQEESQLNLFV
jgi:uncharacterized protein (TIGR00375 family)